MATREATTISLRRTYNFHRTSIFTAHSQLILRHSSLSAARIAFMGGSQYVRPDGSPVRVLVVDDQQVLANLLGQALAHQGWEVRTAGDGYEALRLARAFQPDAVLLDIMMPGLDGYQTLDRLRKQDPLIPVLFLTAKDAVADRIQGLRKGADDYVTKPFDLDEVIARVEAMLRRRGMMLDHSTPYLEVADLRVNPESHQAWRGEHEIQFTATEFTLLLYFMENPNILLTKAQILDRVWSYDFGGQANIVELYIGYIRKKLEEFGPRLIHTIRGAGYILREPRG